MSEGISQLGQDIRYTFRQMGRNPGLTTVMIVILALGIGSSVAMFAVVSSVLLHPLSFPDSRELVDVSRAVEGRHGFEMSWLDYRDIQSDSRLLAGIAVYAGDDIAIIQTEDTTEQIVGARVTGSLFSVLGVDAVLGRVLSGSDEEPGSTPVVLLSHPFWRQQFGGDPNVLGKTIKISGVPHTVIGVMPSNFSFPLDRADAFAGVWLPLRPTHEMLSDRELGFLRAIGRLQSDTTVSAANAELSAIAHSVHRHDPRFRSNVTFSARSYQRSITDSARPALLIVCFAVATVLLVACANVSVLLVTKGVGREQELAMRVALGATRGRLIQQLISEGAVLSFVGVVPGIGLSMLAVRLVRTLPSGVLPRIQDIRLRADTTVALVVITVVSTIISSVIPALFATRPEVQSLLRSSGRHNQVGTRPLGRWLAVAQIVLASVLLAAAWVIFGTLRNLEHSDLGIDGNGVTTFSIFPATAPGFLAMAVSNSSGQETTSSPVLVQQYTELLARIRQTPGIESASLITSPPFSDGDLVTSFTIIGKSDGDNAKNQVRVNAASAQYAHVMGIKVLAGRMLSDDDRENTQFVAVVNESFVRRYFADRGPLDEQISLGGKGAGMQAPYKIVGVLADQVQHDLSAQIVPEIYLPYEQVPRGSIFYVPLLGTYTSAVVKANRPINVQTSIRRLFHDFGREFAVNDFYTIKQETDRVLLDERIVSYLIWLFAAIATAMVAVGMYAVLAQLVTYGRRDIAVRMAVGADRKSVLLMILRQEFSMVVIGLIIGLALAKAVEFLLRAFLYKTAALTPSTYPVVALALLVIGSIAAIIPSRRAVAIDPGIVLRAGS